jgi:glycosyltransferase involved in cell wall biosynthesis
MIAAATPFMKPDISVIVTVHKRIDFLRQALESAIAQTYPAREIIVADDSGNGAAESVCQPLVAAGHVRYRANAGTLGIAASVRSALSEAEGEFVSILNDDDVWEPDFLSRLVVPLQNDPERVLAFCDHWIVSESGTIDQHKSDANTRHYGRFGLAEGDVKDPAQFVLVQNGVPLAMAALFRKAAVDLSLLTDDVAGAYDFWISCLLAASKGKFYFVPHRLSSYRIHPRMETMRADPRKSENHVYIFSQLLECNWFPTMNSYLRLKLAEALFLLGRDRLRFNRIAEARQYFLKSFKTRPGRLSALAAAVSFLPKPLRTWLRLTCASDDCPTKVELE